MRITLFSFACKVQPEEKVTLITDEACKEIAASLVAESNARGCQHHDLVLRRTGTAAAGWICRKWF